VTLAGIYGSVWSMGNPIGVRRDFDALEQRRRKAARLLRRGIPQSEVARRVGVHRQSVSRWDRELKESGLRGLKKAGRAGRKPLLSTADLRRVEAKLKQGAQARGYETELWTTFRVADLIEQECGVRYHPAHVWRILQGLGWSCQRPARRALERDEEKIESWKKKRWPELKKKPTGRSER
jgi:transposase